MSNVDRAMAPLAKAQEFLDAASSADRAGRHSAAASSAVTAAIELRAAGPAGSACASDLDRLLRIKARVQHQSVETSAADGARAVERAGRLVAAAESLLLAR